MQTRDVVISRLADIVGESHLTADQSITTLYTKDHNFISGETPNCVVFPNSATEVQAIVRLANECRIPIVPRSSSIGLHGAGIPTEKGIVVDLKRMNRILEIDERNWYAVIEPGVTFHQLNKELEKKGFRPAKPFLDPPSASVVSTYMERTPVVTAADFTYGSEHVISYTVVTPNGETFTVGHPPLENTPASAPDGPGLNFYRLFQGAQGTLGIVTWMIIRLLPIPKKEKIFFFPCPTLGRLVELVRAVQKYELGLECLAMNNFNWSVLPVDEISGQTELLKNGEYIGRQEAPCWERSQTRQFEDLRDKTPPWVVAIRLAAVGPIPEEKIAYQEADLKEVAAKIGANPQTIVEGTGDLCRLVSDELALSWRMQKRFGYKGSCRQLMFYAPPDQVAPYYEILIETAAKFHYPTEDIGFFLLPIERARAFFCSVDLHLNPNDEDESIRIEKLYNQLASNLLEKGAFFDRPYGKLADMVYGRTGMYSKYLKKLKDTIDPNGIMNPGKLCFR